MKTPPHLPSEEEQALVDSVSVRLLGPDERPRFMRLLDEHHYLGALQPVGEQLLYVAIGPNGGWRALLIFCSAAKHLKHRDGWIGWDNEQRRRRLSLIANNARFLILPGFAVPNLATRVMRLTLDRLSADWQRQYAHPLAIVETFVNPEQFQGTVYKAGGWVEMGMTQGSRRAGRDYYVKHNKPKRLYVRELSRNARRGLQAAALKPEWASVEVKTPPRCTQSAKALRSLAEELKTVPEYRRRIQWYPVWSLLAITALAYLTGGPRGQQDLATFAASMNQGQRRALGIRRDKDGKIPSPTKPTFCRFLKRVNALAVDDAVQRFQRHLRGPVPEGDMIALDGKAAKRSQGAMILNAVALPSLQYLGSEMVPTEKTNEIPIARKLFERLDLEGRLVCLDALHTQTVTACALVQDAGGDYLLTVKGNQEGLEERLQTRFTAIPAVFSPSTDHNDAGMDRRTEQGPTGATPALVETGYR